MNWPFKRKSTQASQQPQLSLPPLPQGVPLSPLTDDEIQKMRVYIGYHARMTSQGGVMHDVVAQNYQMTCALLSVELLARCEDRLKALEVEIQLRSPDAPSPTMFSGIKP